MEESCLQIKALTDSLVRLQVNKPPKNPEEQLAEGPEQKTPVRC